jgi:signal transduction histidine kinase
VKRSALFALISTLLLSDASGQSFSPVRYSINEGMPSNEVYQVFQDSKGFIWFATDVGVVRFDGTEMQKFGTQEGLSDPVVFGFHEDYKGRIWFRTFSGRLSFFENQKIHPYPFNDLLVQYMNTSWLSSIWVDSLDQLWFSTHSSKGVYGLIDKTGKAQATYPDGYEFYFFKVGDGELFGHQQHHASHISIDHKIFPFRLTDGECANWQLRTVIWKGKRYISICEDLFEFDGTSVERVLTGNHPIISLFVDNDDHLWMGSLYGTVQRFSDPSFSKKWSPDFLKGLSVSSMMNDDDGSYWFTTLEQGVFYMPNFSIQNTLISAGGKISGVGLCGDDVLVGFADGNVVVYTSDGIEKRSLSFRAPLTKLHVDKGNDIWITDNAGTHYLSPGFAVKKIFPGVGFSHFSEDRTGKMFAITGRTQLGTIDRIRGTLDFRYTNYTYRSLLVDDSVIYAATRDGLHVYDHDLKFLKEEAGFRNQKISKILKLPESKIVVTSIGNGFTVFDPATAQLARYNTKNNFSANNIYHLVPDGDNLWMATEKGVLKIQVQSLLDGKPETTLISRQNGLISTQINYLLAAGKYIWAFSDNGYSRIDKNAIEIPPSQPRFYLKGIRARNAEVDLTKQTQLPSDKNDLEFDFGFISFQHPAIFLRYRLNKKDAWTYTQNKSLQFNSLAAGDYSLEIEHSTNNVDWASSYHSPVFTILPPLWQTWYFIAGVAVILLALVFSYFRIQVAHQKKLMRSEIKTIEKERSRIAKDLHDSIGTGFTAIKMTVGQLLKKHNDPKSDEVETQFQKTIQEIKTIIYGLTPPGLERYGLMAGLQNYIEKLDGAAPVKFEFNSFGPEIKDPTLSFTVFRIMQELISNSLKHSNADTISIHINSFQDLLNIVYEDNGKGFTWEQVQKGAGLYNIESRLQTVQGKLKFDSGEFGISYTLDIPMLYHHSDSRQQQK